MTCRHQKVVIRCYFLAWIYLSSLPKPSSFNADENETPQTIRHRHTRQRASADDLQAIRAFRARIAGPSAQWHRSTSQDRLHTPHHQRTRQGRLTAARENPNQRITALWGHLHKAGFKSSAGPWVDEANGQIIQSWLIHLNLVKTTLTTLFAS